jgi:hypothetical protein
MATSQVDLIEDFPTVLAEIERVWNSASNGIPATRPSDFERFRTTWEGIDRVYKWLGGKETWVGFNNRDFPYDSAASSPTCGPSCATCSDQYVPFFNRLFGVCGGTEMHSDEQASKNISSLIQQTQANYEFLRNTVETHGDSLVKRWRRKTPTRRIATLKAAKPDIFLHRCADVELQHDLECGAHSDFLRKTHIAVGDTCDPVSLAALQAVAKYTRRHHETLLLPWLDAETLSQGTRSITSTKYGPHDTPLTARYYRSISVACTHPLSQYPLPVTVATLRL